MNTISTAQLRVHGLSHAFARDEVLSGIHFRVRAREIVALVGPSGCGKTTLLHLAAGLLTVQEGQVDNGFAATAFMFQQPRLLPWETALDNVALGLKAAGVKRAERHFRARALALAVDVTAGVLGMAKGGAGDVSGVALTETAAGGRAAGATKDATGGGRLTTEPLARRPSIAKAAASTASVIAAPATSVVVFWGFFGAGRRSVEGGPWSSAPPAFGLATPVSDVASAGCAPSSTGATGTAGSTGAAAALASDADGESAGAAVGGAGARATSTSGGGGLSSDISSVRWGLR